MFRLLALAPVLLVLQPANPSIRDVMKKLNRGPTALTSSITLDLRDADPDWEAIQEQSAEYVKQTAFLLKSKPTKGDAASWERLAKGYHDDARALEAASRRKDARSAQAVLRRINQNCAGCHKAHKPE